MSGTMRRALHYVLKVGDRRKTIHFFRDVLGMKVLRHEEFEEGCKATCNGPYDGKWSKTMIGYGAEDNHFVVELTYNYGIGTYKLGNDFLGMIIRSAKAVANAKKADWPIQEEGNHHVLEAPGGYKFFLVNEDSPEGQDPVEKVMLGSSNIARSLNYWSELAGMTVHSQTDDVVTFKYSDTQAKLELRNVGGQVDHAKAFGRIAFSCPAAELPGIQNKMEENNQKVVTPFISLDTPGKATVQVVILADPDDHEICFVGDEAFRELSQVDPKGDSLLHEAMDADKSDEWYSKKGRSKADA